MHSSNISVVDVARQPVKPVAPDLPLYLADHLFCGLVDRRRRRAAARVAGDPANARWRCSAAVAASLCAGLHAQAPTPSTSGLPTRRRQLSAIAGDEERAQSQGSSRRVEQAAPASAGVPLLAGAQSSAPMPAPIGPGDFLDISEYHTPEFHSTVRVSASRHGHAAHDRRNQH